MGIGRRPPTVVLPNGGTYVPVKKKMLPRGKSAKRPAEDPGADPTDDAAAESARRQEGLERRASDRPPGKGSDFS